MRNLIKLLLTHLIFIVIAVSSGLFQFSVGYFYVTYQCNLTTDMGFQYLQIIFDSPNAIFTPGQTITGRVWIVASSTMKIRSVKLIFEGKAKTSWTVYLPTSLITNEAEEKYFENKITLAGEGGPFYLEVGQHVYPFQFSLPQQLPSTFTHKNGHVRYEAIIRIEIPWGINKTMKRLFEVIAAPINLNNQVSLTEPQISEIKKFYWCNLRNSGPMTLAVSIPYSGFVPGQFLPFAVKIDNKSNVVIKAVTVQLKKIFRFQAKRPSSDIKSCSSVLQVLTLQGVKPYSSKKWVDKIIVPNNLTLCNLKHCGIISENYELNVIVHPNGIHTKTEVNFQITLGYVP